jgi:hypothetical protein
MRLLKHSSNDDFDIISFDDDDPAPYAILSHTWIDGKEVTYDELVAGTGKYFWVDTCCINKSKLPRIRSVTAGVC